MTLHVSNKMLRVATIAVATALALSTRGKNEDRVEQQGGAAAGRQAPALKIRVVTIYPQQVATSTNPPGRLESLRSASVHAQVGGIIKKRLFREGSYVKVGQPFYQLDDVTYVASLENTHVQLATAEASLAKANADLVHYKPPVAADAISKQDYDTVVISKCSGGASIKPAKAVIKSAQINIGYSRTTAPISGCTGQSRVSEGSLVGADDSVVLVTIQQASPIYVNLTQSATDVIRLKRDIAGGRTQAINGVVEVGILLENGTGYSHKGRLLLADLTVNETTGQVTLHAEVPGKDNVLLPGLYVYVHPSQTDIADSLVVPQQAVTQGTEDMVLIVNARGGTEPREITVARQQGINWIITAGLNDSDGVVVEGASIATMLGARKATPKERILSGSRSAASAPQSAAPPTRLAAQTAPEAKPVSAVK